MKGRTEHTYVQYDFVHDVVNSCDDTVRSKIGITQLTWRPKSISSANLIASIWLVFAISELL